MPITRPFRSKKKKTEDAIRAAVEKAAKEAARKGAAHLLRRPESYWILAAALGTVMVCWAFAEKREVS